MYGLVVLCYGISIAINSRSMLYAKVVVAVVVVFVVPPPFLVHVRRALHRVLVARHSELTNLSHTNSK